MSGDPEMRRQLEASLERLDLAARAAGIGFWDWDLLNDRLSSDAYSATLYGLSPMGASAEPQLARLIHPQDLAGFKSDIASALASGERSQHRCRVVQPGGSILHLDFNLKVTRDARGKATRLLAMVSDVTSKVERTARLEQLVTAEHALVERLSVATQAAGIFVWEFDWIAMSISFDENRLTRGSSNRHFGAELGADFFKYVHEDDRHIGMNSMRAALQKGEHDASFRYRLKLPDGVIRHIQAYARTSQDGAGNPVRSVGVSWDITSEVQAADQLAVKVGNERQLLERLSVAIQAAGLNCWEFSYANDKFTWIDQLPDGYDARELDIEQANRILSGPVVPEDAAAIRAETERALASGAQTLSSRMRAHRHGRTDSVPPDLSALLPGRGGPPGACARRDARCDRRSGGRRAHEGAGRAAPRSAAPARARLALRAGRSLGNRPDQSEALGLIELLRAARLRAGRARDDCEPFGPSCIPMTRRPPRRPPA